MNELAIIEFDGYIPFDEYRQPAVLPHLPFRGLTENIAVAYLDFHLKFVLRKIKRKLWSDEVCRYMNDYPDENAICLNTEDVCPRCYDCDVSTQ